VEGDEQSGYLVMMKTDENVDKVRTLVRRDGHLGHYNDSGGNEYVQRNGKTNFNNKFEHEKSVCQNGPKEFFLARKQIPTLEHAPYSSDLAPFDSSLFPKLKSSLRGTHF